MEFEDTLCELDEMIDDFESVKNPDVEEQVRNLLVEKARELIEVADNEDFDEDDEDDGIAHATLRTAQIKSIDFSEDGVTTVNMRSGEPLIFKDVFEIMFIGDNSKE